jgi:hypothetical protein
MRWAGGPAEASVGVVVVMALRPLDQITPVAKRTPSVARNDRRTPWSARSAIEYMEHAVSGK